jgi:transcriptional regulator GlxA family with amidase domain
MDAIAAQTGFANPERMRRAFLRAFGQPPQGLRRTARAKVGESRAASSAIGSGELA